MSGCITPTVVFSPKTFDLPNELRKDQRRHLGKLLIAALQNIDQNGVILQPDSNEKPWINGFKDFNSDERICLMELLKKISLSKRLIRVPLNGNKLNDCQQIKKLKEIEALDFCILPLDSICNFPLCCLMNTPNLRIDEFLSEKSSKIFNPLFRRGSYDISSQFGNINDLGDLFFKRLFNFTKNIEIIDKYAGQNLISTAQDTHYYTLSWIYEIFKATNRNQGNFIIHTTTTDSSPNIRDIENNAHRWKSQQNLDPAHEIIIKVYPHRTRCYSFPHHRVLHTDQFSFLLDAGFAFITDNLSLKNQANYITFFDQWRDTFNTLRNLGVNSTI